MAPDPRSTSRLANDAWESLLTAHAAVLKGVSAADRWSEVSMREYDVLYTLSKRDGPIRARELNKQVLLSQPALSRLLDRLAERGMIDR
ncbi:MAG: MarR family transcriptional regulator, partial [Gordonia amarae]